MRTSSAIILAIVVVATAAASRMARAGDDCLVAPNAGAPPGSHWYYRFDRVTHRKCWYVGPQGTKVRRAAATPPAAARAPVAPLSTETAAVDVPAPTPAPDAAFASRWPDAPTPGPFDPGAPGAGAGAAPAALDVPERIAARPVTTSAERAPPPGSSTRGPRGEPAPPPATAAVADESPSLPAALAGVAALLAVVGTILVRAGRRAAAARSPHWARSFDELAARAAGPSLWDEVRSPDERREPRYPGTPLVPDIANATVPPEIDPMPAAIIDPAPDVEQSLRQLLQAWERRAA
jgi:hypothetical protein